MSTNQAPAVDFKEAAPIDRVPMAGRLERELETPGDDELLQAIGVHAAQQADVLEDWHVQLLEHVPVNPGDCGSATNLLKGITKPAVFRIEGRQLVNIVSGESSGQRHEGIEVERWPHPGRFVIGHGAPPGLSGRGTVLRISRR